MPKRFSVPGKFAYLPFYSCSAFLIYRLNEASRFFFFRLLLRNVTTYRTLAGKELKSIAVRLTRPGVAEIKSTNLRGVAVQQVMGIQGGPPFFSLFLFGGGGGIGVCSGNRLYYPAKLVCVFL